MPHPFLVYHCRGEHDPSGRFCRRRGDGYDSHRYDAAEPVPDEEREPGGEDVLGVGRVDGRAPTDHLLEVTAETLVDLVEEDTTNGSFDNFLLNANVDFRM